MSSRVISFDKDESLEKKRMVSSRGVSGLIPPPPPTIKSTIMPVYVWADDKDTFGVAKSLSEYQPFLMNTQKLYSKDKGVSIFKTVHELVDKDSIVVTATDQFLETTWDAFKEYTDINPEVEYVFFSVKYKEPIKLHPKKQNLCFVNNLKSLNEHIGSLILTKTLQNTGLNDVM